MARKPPVPRVPRVGGDLERFLRVLKERAEIEDGLRSEDDMKPTRQQMVDAAVTNASSITGPKNG